MRGADATVTFHDPCYLGRHNGVYDAPRNVLQVLPNDLWSWSGMRENSFCCGAGGAQFWKEEEAGDGAHLGEPLSRGGGYAWRARREKVLAVGCPFCKSMLDSTPGKSGGGSW